MTICAAALAADSKAIVCIADRALTFDSGQENGPPLQSIQWDSDSTKIVPLNQKGVLCMFSGGEDGISRVLSKFLARDAMGNTALEIRNTCETDFKESRKELVELRILQPNLLNLEIYTHAVSARMINPFMQGLADQVNGFDLNCDMLICGFDSKKEPFIHYAVSRCVVDDMVRTGFQAIGSGWPYVHAKLLWSDHKRTHDIGRVLFDMFNAKASAEMDPHVGFDWDAHLILLKDDLPQQIDVPKEIKELIEAGWRKHDRSPFEKRNPKEDLPDPPRRWQGKLKEYGESLIKS